MSIKTIYTAAFIAVTLVLAVPASASALDSEKLHSDPLLQLLQQRANPAPVLPELPQEAEPPDPKPDPAPVKYTVRSGDNLTKIAKQFDTSWLRLWNKNTDLDNPDLIYPGQAFLIPDDSEELKDRPVPEAVVVALSAPSGPSAVRRGPVAGNTYDYGYCTWYVKNRRPDLPNNLGNANTWYSRAAAQGYSVGSKPRAGAVGVDTGGEYGHVVYVQRVNGDGTVLIAEMNYRAWNVSSTRTVSAGSFLYIY